MHIPGLPEEITRDSHRAALAALGLPVEEGRITAVLLLPDSVEVTFLRERSMPDSQGRSMLLRADRNSLARVTVPIVVTSDEREGSTGTSPDRIKPSP